MKAINLILSVLICICAIGMLTASIINDSPLKGVSISVNVIIFAFSLILVRLTYKENVDEPI